MNEYQGDAAAFVAEAQTGARHGQESIGARFSHSEMHFA